MLSLYEILKASKTGIAPDMWTALAGMNWGGADSGAEVKELTGIPPLSFRADGTPLLDYLISGNMSQTGTPTPDSPVMPQGTGERTAQLYFKKMVSSSIGADGSIIGNASFDCYVAKVEANQQYIGTGFVYAFYTSEPALGSSSYNRQRVAEAAANGFTSPIDGYVAVRHNIGVTDAMLNLGETALPYEPYGYKIPILNNSQTTNVYLGEVQSTRNVAKYVLTGEENIDYYSTAQGSLFRRIIGGTIGQEIYGYAICTHYSVTTVAARANNTLSGNASTINTNLDFIDNRYNSAADFKAYLQQQYANGTPVTIWYVLAEPTTGIVNEPIRKIGNYADTLSYEQARVQIPTLHGNTVIDVETTLKPSEMYIKYQK